jgi:hypothetical protein
MGTGAMTDTMGMGTTGTMGTGTGMMGDTMGMDTTGTGTGGTTTPPTP